MLRAFLIASALCLISPPLVFAQAPAFNSDQKLGQRLFYQHCGVCHTKPYIVGRQYGPVLSKAIFASAKDSDIKAIIATGTPNMPGFQYTLKPSEIDAVVSYLRQTPAPPAAAK